MASEIKVDTIVNAGGDNDTGIDLATNDQILLKVANATKLTMNSTGQTTIVGEGGTTTTSVQQGLAKTWVNFDGTASGAASRDSFNVSGMTDNGTGDYTISHSNDFANANYSTVGASAFNAWCGPDYVSGTLAGSVDVYTQTGTHTKADRDILNFASLGDLA